MYEHHQKPLLPRSAFYARLSRNALAAFAMMLGALGVGVLGYHFFEKQTWIDAFANAAMILSGMGPLGPLQTTGGKIFAGCYALFSGLAFIVIIGVVWMPVVHRLFHKFHLDMDDAPVPASKSKAARE